MWPTMGGIGQAAGGGPQGDFFFAIALWVKKTKTFFHLVRLTLFLMKNNNLHLVYHCDGLSL